MTFPIFIDVNIPIYAAGRPHPLKEPCAEIIRLIAVRRRDFWTSAEILQEILHRYMAVNRWVEGRRVFEDFAELMQGRVEPILARDVRLAAELAGRLKGLAARDLLHLAVMARVGSDTLVSADRGFDRTQDVKRLDPADVAVWRGEVGSP